MTFYVKYVIIILWNFIPQKNKSIRRITLWILRLWHLRSWMQKWTWRRTSFSATTLPTVSPSRYMCSLGLLWRTAFGSSASLTSWTIPRMFTSSACCARCPAAPASFPQSLARRFVPSCKMMTKCLPMAILTAMSSLSITPRTMGLWAKPKLKNCWVIPES